MSVTATDGTHSAVVYFNWTVAKSFVVVNPGTVLFPENLPVYLQMQAVNGSAPYTYSATGLPLSLQIDPNTGLISGTLAEYANSSGNFVNFSVTVSATDSTHKTVSTNFIFGTEPGFYLTGVGNQTNRAGDVVDNFLGAFNADQNATLVTSVTGLPPGLSYDPATHLVTGTIDGSAFNTSPFLTTVTVFNQTFNYTYTTTFNWTVTPAIVMANPGAQTSVVGAVVNLPIVVTQSFGQPVTFSTSSELPLGLTLDPNTGVISGTIGPQLNSSADFDIDIYATDGTVDGDLLFHWHVGQAAANVVQLYDPTSGGNLTLTSPVGTTLTAQIDTESSYYDSGIIESFPLGYLTMSVQGVAPGGAANVAIHSSTLVNPADYFVYSPTAANSNYHWYDFLYQHQTDTDDASTTGAEFLPDGDIVLHLVDGGRGDADLTADGQITVNADGPTALALSAQIVGAPATWPAGVPLTLASDIGGSAAPGASLQWQGYYTSDFDNYYNLPDGTAATYTFTPPQSGYYYVNLTATSADGSVTVTDYGNYLYVPSAAVGTGPIGAFTIGGIPSDILAGQAVTATILADDASGNPLDGYTGPISVQITDSQNNTIYSTSGNFDPSQFTLGPITLNAVGTSSTTDTITITAGSATVSLPIVVHPVSQFVPLQNPLTVAEQTPFSLSFAAEDDRGVFDANYSGSARLVYTDQQGEHDLSGGFQAVSGGVVAFQNVVLPSGGVYLVQAVSADGNVVGATFVDSQGTVVDNTPPSSSVALLPSYETSTSFSVEWSGNDDANGSGIASYDVYVSDNGGAYTLFQSHTTGSSATFSGQDGHRYGFYSVATDNAGNVEQAPDTPDATTLVDVSAPVSMINALATYQGSANVQLTWAGSDGANGSGIAGFDIYVSDNGGAYSLWKHEGGTTLADTYVGADGHRYAFYSVATDNAGNVEQPPDAADASTLIDVLAPTSAINPLSAAQQSTNIQLSWSGSDGANGSGIAGFDIYVSDNSGAYVLWKHESGTTTSDVYVGTTGHSYQFYSRATDNAGNVEAAPGTADATTLIDATAPSSSVAALPQYETVASFTVSWSGTDAGGPGIATYSVYVSTNGGAYTAFQTNTAQTSATFTGASGNTYGFYSIATDNAGIAQATPATAQASTTVYTVPPTSSVAALPQYETGTNFTVSWSGTDADGPGIATYSVYVSTNGGAYTAFQTNTAQTSATFTGASGNTYSFYSTATDKAGNVEAPHTSADTSTMVQLTQNTQVQVSSDHPSGSTYGQTVQFTATVSVGTGTPTGSVQFEIDSVDVGAPVTLSAGAASFSTSAFTATSHTITAVYTSDSSDFGNSQGHIAQAVSPAPLIVTADSPSKVYGAVLPSLTFTTSTLVNGDTAATALTGALATTATAASPVANYPITQGTLVAANYTITFAPGTLAVTAAPLTVTAGSPSKVYGAALPALTFSAGAFVNGDTAATALTGGAGDDGDGDQPGGQLSDHAGHAGGRQLHDHVRSRLALGHTSSVDRDGQQPQQGVRSGAAELDVHDQHVGQW